MRILKILGGDDYGGQFTCECQFIKYWTKKGIDVDAYILGEGKALSTYKSLVSEYKVLPELNARFGGGLATTIKGILSSISYPLKLDEYLTLNANYDAIIYRSQTYMHLAKKISTNLKCKVFWHLPNSVNKRSSKVYFNFFLRRLGVIPVANSKYTQKSLGEICEHIIYPGYDEARVKNSRRSFRDTLNISDDSIVFGVAARIHPSKAQDIIIKAFLNENLYKQNAHLLLAGYPTDKQFEFYCKELAENKFSNIHFLGNVNDMSEFYNTIDVYINSRRDAEPFGISIAEAMGAGKPVIAYYRGGPSEMIDHNQNGWLVYNSNKEDYGEVMSLAVSKPEQLVKMGELSTLKAEEFSSAVNAEKFIDVIKSNYTLEKL